MALVTPNTEVQKSSIVFESGVEEIWPAVGSVRGRRRPGRGNSLKGPVIQR